MKLHGKHGNMLQLFSGIYKDKTVLVTGHTGFKGSWLCLWLQEMGAKVIGYSLTPPTQPNHIDLLDLNIISIEGDIRDLDKLNMVMKKYKPDIVFHLAAQPIVRLSYSDPIQTYETNVIGTLKVFEASKQNDVKAIVNITSDKVYENKEKTYSYVENDTLGGYDPYSSSKACSEILTSSYRDSYFNTKDYKKIHNTLLSSCRAGNVIGGGDWGLDRLVPDIMSSISTNEIVSIRNPHAVRPWQHVLEPLSGYLNIGQKLLEEKKEFAQSWNFGPANDSHITVEEVIGHIQNHCPTIKCDIQQDSNNPHEANLLMLDSTKAHTKLKWKSVWDIQTTFKKTAQWYKDYYLSNQINTKNDLIEYIDEAKAKKICWTI